MGSKKTKTEKERGEKGREGKRRDKKRREGTKGMRKKKRKERKRKEAKPSLFKFKSVYFKFPEQIQIFFLFWLILFSLEKSFQISLQ